MEKSWYKSVTILSAVAFAGISELERRAVVPAGFAQSVADLVQNLLIVSGVFGVRRAIG